MDKIHFEIPVAAKKDKRPKIIGKAVLLVWQSLESHLISPYYNGKKYTKKDILFHQQCVRDYAELIKLLAELY